MYLPFEVVGRFVITGDVQRQAQVRTHRATILKSDDFGKHDFFNRYTPGDEAETETDNLSASLYSHTLCADLRSSVARGAQGLVWNRICRIRCRHCVLADFFLPIQSLSGL